MKFLNCITTITLIFLSIINNSNASCVKKSENCIEGTKTKIIDGFEVSKECWKYKVNYDCSSNIADSCDAMRGSDCFEIDSNCIETIAGKCVRSEKNFHCDKYEKVMVEEERTRFASSGIKQVGGVTCITELPCSDGSCADKSYETNNEMLSSVAQLQVFKEMQKQLKTTLDTIFKGEDSRCSKAILGWKECCVKGKGWGTEIKFDSCKPEELSTAKKTAAGLCHEINGSYCDKRIAGFCRLKKKSFCCFSSKLVRAIHEQGRAQLGIGWGDPRSPNCQGLTPEQLAKIDFSKLDLSEIYHDIITKYKKPDIKQLTKDIEQELNIAVENLKTNGEEVNSGIIKKNTKEGL